MPAPRSLRSRTGPVLGSGLVLGVLALGVAPRAAADGPRAARWTAATPDAMVDLALARAANGGEDALAGLVTAVALDDRASFGRVRRGLAALAAAGGPLADEARMLALELTPDAPPAAWPGIEHALFDAPPDAHGLVRNLAVIGPFRDTGGGLTKREGPEAEGESFANAGARYSWGAYQVGWQRALPDSVSARGLPLDLYITPRAESCSYLASQITVPNASSAVVVHVAASGMVRLMWDGADVASAEDVHPKLVLDRLAARLHPEPGAHLLALKVCSYSVADEGRVRVRFTDERGAALALASSSDLRAVSVPARAEAPRSDVLETPLAHALALGRAPGEGARDSAREPALDEALAVAVLRTLGGADDLRSPRAPGLIDRVARAAESAPDAVAMAGWVAPPDATRSGWLNLARSRGREAGDGETEAFAARRLVAAYLGTGLSAWALAETKNEPLASAPDTEAVLLRALAQRALGGEGLEAATFSALQALETRLGEAMPLSVLAELEQMAGSRPELRRRYAEVNAARHADARGPHYVGAFAADGAEALERAALANVARQVSADDLANIGNALVTQGRNRAAHELYATASRLSPNSASAFRGLAATRFALAAGAGRATDATGDAGATRDAEQQAIAELQRASELEPGDVGLKAELAFRTSAGSAGSMGRERQSEPDERYLAAPEVFLERARAAPLELGVVADRQLHWLRVATYHADSRVSQLIQYAREIGIEPRTESERFESLPIEGPQSELVRARVHRKDGTIAQPDEQASTGTGAYVRWPVLHSGDVVEIAVRSWTAGPVGRRGDAPYYFVDPVGMTDTHPVLFKEIVIDAPQSSPFAIDVLHGKPDRMFDSDEDGRRVTHYVWDHPPNVPDEPLSPSLTEVLPVLIGSTFPGWDAFRTWYQGAVKGFTEPDEEVRSIAAKLTQGKRTRDEKLRALFDFVADDIRYENYVSREWWLPNRPQELLASRQGDCDDKALLLITLLRSIGIEATEVLVQTRYTAQPSLLASKTAAIPMFDHGIAYLPGENGKPGIWLDATSPESRIGPLPSMDARARALFADEGPPEIIATPASSPAEHGVDAAWTLTLEASGRATIVAAERHAGDAAFQLRGSLKEEGARVQWLEQYLSNGWFPALRMRTDGCASDDAPPGDACHEKPAVTFTPYVAGGFSDLGYRASSETFVRREGDELAVPVSTASTLTSDLAPLPRRKLAVVLPPSYAPSHDNRTITLVAPEGYVFAELPPDGDEDGGEFGRAHLDFKRAAGKNAVVVTRSLLLDLATIPVEKYAAWRAWLERVDGLMHRMVRLVPAQRSKP